MAKPIKGQDGVLMYNGVAIPIANWKAIESKPKSVDDQDVFPPFTVTITNTGKWTWVRDKTMSHHITEITPEAREKLFGEFDRLAELGATGRFPDGKIGYHDKGEIRFDISAASSTQLVVIDFGDPVRLVALTVDEAQGMIDSLTDKLMELRGIA